MVTTNKRLDVIASFVTLNDVVGDIGSDHGYIPLLLNKRGHKYVYASDNKPGPFRRLKNAVSTISSGIIDVKLEDGIKTLPRKVNTLILTGMGGALIISILSVYPENLKNIHKLILGPQGNEKEVRAFLETLKFKISDEAVVHDDKFYEIIVAVRGREKLSERAATFGPVNLQTKSETFINKWHTELVRIENLLQNPQLTNERKRELTHNKNVINEVLKEKR